MIYLTIKMEDVNSSSETISAAYSRNTICFETVCCCFCKKMSLNLPDWIGNRKHSDATEYMQKFYNWDSRNYVFLLQSVGGLAFPLLGVGEVFHWGSLWSYLHLSVYTTDFADADVLEEPHKFVPCVITFHLTYFHGWHISLGVWM